jgi:hypothetical protein
MSDRKDDEFLQRARTELDRGARALDELTVARLRAARRRALDAAPRRRIGLVAAAFAATAVTAGLVALLVFTPAANPPAVGLEQIDLLVEAEIDLYDNLEFYRWLTEQQHAG